MRLIINIDPIIQLINTLDLVLYRRIVPYYCIIRNKGEVRKGKSLADHILEY